MLYSTLQDYCQKKLTQWPVLKYSQAKLTLNFTERERCSKMNVWWQQRYFYDKQWNQQLLESQTPPAVS